MNSDLHIHIPLGFTGTMTVGDDGQITVTSAEAPASAAATSWPTLDATTAQELEEMLTRHKNYDPTTRSRDITAFLMERGWKIRSNLKAGYILCEYAGTERAVTLYLSSKDLNNAKKSQREFMMSLPDVDVHEPDVRIQMNGSHYEQALKNIETVEKWAGS